jgi:hypothetical protein
VEPEIVPEVAVITVVPWDTAVNTPALLIVPTAVLLEVQVKAGVALSFIPFWSRAVALNCWVSGTRTTRFDGPTVIEFRAEVAVLAMTVTVVVPEIVPDLAVIVAVPGAIPLICPLLSTVTIPLLLEVQLVMLIAGFMGAPF